MKKKTKRHIIMLKLFLLSVCGKNFRKAEVLRKSNIFGNFGGGGYWHPNRIPTHAEQVFIGNNVVVAADVKFYEHDLINIMVNNSKLCSKNIPYYKGNIIVGDNVMIGGNSIILYDTKIGNNSIVAAGSVVKGKFPEGVVIGGNPARIICSIETILNKRLA